MTGKAIDCGNYTDVPTPDQVRCLLSQGYTKAIIGTSFGDVADAQIFACESAGMDVEEYQFPNATKTTKRPWWLDCETDASTVATIRAICRWVNPPTGIYTRRGWWLTNTQNWDIKSEFPWLRLWDASYGDPPPAFVSYGGFTQRAMHQWHDSTQLCGLNVDLNIIEEEHMTQEEFNKMINASPLKAALDAMYGTLISLVQHVYGTDDPKLADAQKKLDAIKAALNQ